VAASFEKSTERERDRMNWSAELAVKICTLVDQAWKIMLIADCRAVVGYSLWGPT
jgi:hypothetical protein